MGAEQAELVATQLGLEHPDVSAAERALNEGRLEDAERLIRPYLRRHPEDAGAALILGTIAERCDAPRDAENLFRRAALLVPAYVEADIALARLLNATGRSGEAVAALDRVLARRPEQPVALRMRARLLWQMRRLDEAEAAHRELLEHCSGDLGGWIDYAHLLKSIGRRDDCLAAYRRAIEKSPTLGLAWWGLANVKSLSFEQADVEKMEAAVREATDQDDLIHLHFALGKGLADLRNYQGSFEHYRIANSLRRAEIPHDAERVRASVARSTEVFTSAFYKKRRGWGSQAHDPIFIVSLPRSGSTLIEQILASHPSVEGTEELRDIERIATEIGGGNGPGSYFARLACLTPSEVLAAGDGYIEATRRFRQTDRPFFTDKMPTNWMFTELIHLILPRAKIIDIRRHPLACGFANFTQHYNRGHTFAYDLSDIGDYYREYVRQMAHLDEVAPGSVHRVIYEQLVDDTESEVRRLFDYLELPFDVTCLRFFENDRAVHTPSAEQVRRPINRDGLDRWRSYSEWLAPLEAVLGAALDCYPSVPPDLRSVSTDSYR